MKNKIHSLIIEGIVFCGSGLGLLSYSLKSYQAAFNKDWSQSPYLFPLLVGAALVGLSIWIMGQGVQAMKKGQGGAAEKGGEAEAAGETKIQKSHEKASWVFGAFLICALYYLALSILKLPQITIGILSFSVMISTFEIATVFFLIAMMFFMGVRKPLVLILVPVGTSLFLSIAFRTCLHVLLP